MVMKAKMSSLGGASRQGVGGTLTDNLTATGSTQATALVVADDFNVVTTSAASTGVMLRPDLACAGPPDPGDRMVVVNLGVSTLSVYPPVGGQINALGANNAFSVPAGKTGTFVVRSGGLAAMAFAGFVSA